MNIFEEGSPFIRFLNRMADLLILNLITLLMCLPLITAGASLTAMHYVLLKMVRGEEGYIAGPFFRSLKRNLRQATILWLMFAALWAMLLSSLFLIVQDPGAFPSWLPFPILIAAMFLLIVMIYTFALLSRYENSVPQTLFNGFALTFGRLPRSLAMLVIVITPILLYLWTSAFLPLLVLFGLSVPGYACAMVYEPVFRRIEEQRDN